MEKNYIDAPELFERRRGITFAKLDGLIRSGMEVIELESDVHMDRMALHGYQKGIRIGDDVVIDGRGHTIDALNEGRIFHILAGNVTLKNIVFKNATVKSSRLDGGSAILNEGDLRIVDCIFEDNESPSIAGAISNLGRLEILKSKFTGNVAPHGAAVYNVGDLNLDACIIENNTAKECGVIVNKNDGQLNIKDCSFKQNSGTSLVNQAGTVEIINTKIEEETPHDKIINDDGKVRIATSDLKYGADGALVLNRKGMVVVGECMIDLNRSSGSLIENHGQLEINKSHLKNSDSKNFILNGESALLGIFDCEITNNQSLKSAVCNLGENAVVKKTLFEANRSETEHADDIYNNTRMTLDDVDIRSEEPTIFNEGILYVRGRRFVPEKVFNNVINHGEIVSPLD